MLFPQRPRGRSARVKMSERPGKAGAQRSRPGVESIEDRVLLATFLVSNLNDAGAGSLRQALIDANAVPGSATEPIQFAVAGTITLTSGPLPSITHPVDIDGASAPGFSRTPVVEVDDNGFAGLRFDVGSAGSTLQSIGLVHASSDALTLNDHDITVVGNFIGLRLDGTTPASNGGDGLVINPTSFHDTIGAATTDGTLISLASNVISANVGDGIAVHGSSGNVIVANYIGTDLNGTAGRGNAGNGVVFDQGASGNFLGGTVPFVNSDGQVPLSNLISGNEGDGVLITGGSSFNALAGNLIGTDATGNAPLGNRLDGVGILDGSDNNVLRGTTFTQSPFIYANIVGGNGGNGLRVSDSDNTVIQANIFGIGEDNKTPLGNAGDGALLEGTSANTQVGGVIPLGNICSANGQNGLEIRDTVSGTIAFNTFTGIAAFEDYPNLGNGQDGMLVTATGGNNTIRTTVISSNHANGIEIGGEATGVQVTDAIIGLNTNGSLALPNGANGILIDGDAHGNAIGGFQPSVVPQVTISANLGHGVLIAGTAHDNSVFHSDIGTAIEGRTAIGNGGAGIYLAPGTFANTIGGADPSFANVISGNLGNGIELSGTGGNTISGNLIGVQSPGKVVTALLPLPNGGSGIVIDGSNNNLIGGTAPGAGNTVAFNAGAGVLINSGAGNAILGNSIFDNAGGGIVLRPGANGDQAAPTLTQIIHGVRRTVIGGRLMSAPNSNFLIQFFANNSVDPSRSPAGRTFLGSETVQTNGRGVALIRFAVPTPAGRPYFTTTATSAARNTSAFSNGVPAPRAKPFAGWPGRRIPSGW